MTKQTRCAIYTRKSSEEGLEQSFNSLDAQREACEAYVRSQKHEGWHIIRTRYDDGGFSGGNMDRPALNRLMVDIEARKVDVVVVYKVDRLTRSLGDFARIIEQFDKHQVTFVSVTQQFNTTSSMGRLTLNVLLSFAQFEREVTSERIRDKIAASKRKGMWMGGRVPLGYDLRNRKLYINAGEAETVREIYTKYLQLGSVAALKDYLDSKSIRTKVRTGDGRHGGGTSFSRGCLYQILGNSIYAGEIAHRGAVYPGEHQAIIEREQWEQVQNMLLEHRQGKCRRPRRTEASLLTGILFDKHGNRLTPTHASKAGRRYRYYTSQAVIRKANRREPGSRIPAHDLELAVMSRVVKFLRSPDELLRKLMTSDGATLELEGVLQRAGKLANGWLSMGRSEQGTFLETILWRVIVEEGSIAIQVNRAALVKYLGGPKWLRPSEDPTDHDPETRIIALDCPFQFAPRGKAFRMIIGNDPTPPAASSAATLKAVARARFWYDQIVTGEATCLSDLARRHKLTTRYVRRIFRLAILGPAGIEMILRGEYSFFTTLDTLADRIPLEWASQSLILAGGKSDATTSTG